jgi:DNA helicase HerA-like ATPase
LDDQQLERAPFTMPSPDQRVLILGSTGSGKTTFGAWLLSKAPFDRMPYVVIDYKLDDLLGAIERIRPLSLDELPKEAGLYHLKPNPIIDDDAVEDWLLRVHATRNIGLYVDEGLRMPAKKTGAFETILTQGRSLTIPAITLSQRPVDLTRYAFSEANHVIVFRLTDQRDRKKVAEYVPIDPDYKLKKYHSLWYNVGEHSQYSVRPAPNAETILGTIDQRMAVLDELQGAKYGREKKVI